MNPISKEAFPTLTQRKKVRARILEENRRYPDTMVLVPHSDYKAKPPRELQEVWRSRTMLCQIYQYGGVTRLTISSTDYRAETGAVRDGLSWDELMQVKRECGFGAYEAVEIYPADANIVNVANMRHLWITGEAMPFGWDVDSGGNEKCRGYDRQGGQTK